MESAATYQWGRQTLPVDAQVVGDAIREITEAEGLCSPQRLVKEAKPKTSPLHTLFTWDNVTAANAWRTHQARNVINSLVYVYQEGDREYTVPAFISVGHTAKNQGQGEGYRDIRFVMGDPDFKSEALAEALSRLQSLRKRYESLSELSPVWNALDQVAA